MRQEIDYSELTNLTKAARFLDVSYMTIHRWIKSGKLHTVIIGGSPFIALGDLRKIKGERQDGKTAERNS